MVIRSYSYLKALYRYHGMLLLLAEETVAIWLIAHLYV